MAVADVYYPWAVDSLDALRREMDRAAELHGRTSLCAWICTWLPGRPIVRWAEAERMVRA